MHSRAPAEPSKRAFEAVVTAVDDDGVELDRTWFYPQGGGQPADSGTIAGHEVVDVQNVGDTVRHRLASTASFEEGETVDCAVDDEFRTYCMRAHTASHLLYGAGRRLLDDLGYGGFDITSEKVRVDFATSTDIDDSTLVALERLVNQAVWDSRPVSWEERSLEDARSDDDVAFNTKTEEGVMAESESVRIVTVEGWDVAACGGTHVSNTREIGPVSVLERSNPGEGLTRVEFAVGERGIDNRAAMHESALGAARTLGVPVTEVDEAVRSLAREKESLAETVTALRGELLDTQIASFEVERRDGDRWRIGTVSGMETNAVGEAAKRHVEKEDVDAVAVVGDEARPFVVVATTGSVQAGAVIDRLTEEFGGGGGGGAAFAQGGGLDASAEAVVDWLRSGPADKQE